MKVVDFSKTNSILNQYVSEIRNVEVQNDRLRFRRNIERIGEIMAYEISKEFHYSTKDIQSPLGKEHSDTSRNRPSQHSGQPIGYQYYSTCRSTFSSRLPKLF